MDEESRDIFISEDEVEEETASLPVDKELEKVIHSV